MHRIDHPTAVAERPAPAAPGTPGYFDGGDPQTARDATWVTPDWANDVQENICQVVEAAGIALAKGDVTQLLKAIQYFSGKTALPLGVPVPFIGSQSVVPSNCVLLMGQTVSRASYPALAAFALASGVIVDDATWLAQPMHRTKFSSGDGASTIRLPDLRGESIYGADLGRGIRSGNIGDWLAGDMQPHSHGATTDAQGSHNHTGTTDSQGAHNHGGQTGAAGAHNHANGVFSRLLRPPYVGSITGSDTTNSGDEQAVGGGDSGDIAPAPDHVHGIPVDGSHFHNLNVNAAGVHVHGVTVASAGGSETRQRGTNYPYIMRVL